MFIQPNFLLGVIQQLCGQEEGEGGPQKFHACRPRGGGGSLECPHERKFWYHCALDLL